MVKYPYNLIWRGYMERWSLNLLPTHLWGFLLFCVVIASRWASMRRCTTLTPVRDQLCVCVTVCFSIVGLALWRRSYALAHFSRGEDGRTLRGSSLRQSLHGRARWWRAGRGVESGGCSVSKKIQRCASWLPKTGNVSYCMCVHWPFHPQTQCRLCVYESHRLSMTEVNTHVVTNSQQLIMFP